MASITIANLSKVYGDDKSAEAALADLHLDIGDNQFVTLLGPSGCGKTTTLRLIAGYMVPEAGTIHVDECLLSSPGGVVPAENRGMGMVFQNYALYPHMTVRENMGYPLRIAKMPKELREKRVRLYDSLHGEDPFLLDCLKRWVRDEHENKKGEAVDTSDWTAEHPKAIPRQMNGCDCGVFMLKYADYIAVGCPLTFHQRDMEYFRRRIVADAMEKGN